MRRITMSQFRAEPGEYIRATQRGGRAFLITKGGKAAARLLPPDEPAVIAADGSVRGELPLTLRRNLGGHY
jgi:prevent-host-death family protein